MKGLSGFTLRSSGPATDGASATKGPDSVVKLVMNESIEALILRIT
jgi:hypothetical protein